MSLNFSENLSKFKETLINSKKYWLLYLIFIIITSLSVVGSENFIHPKFELITFAFIAILGILSIVYYFMHDSDKELYKVAFIIILCFGIIFAFILPISEVSDEGEHFIRSEITSRGDFFPHWTGDDLGFDRHFNLTEGEISTESNNKCGFYTIDSAIFFLKNREVTVFEVDGDTDSINHTKILTSSAFQQNPFYGYLPQAIGVLLAKLLDLNLIWMLWLGRICNLICYAALISYAIKKTPYLKIPLLAVACIPLAIYQSASMSIDSLIYGLGILIVAYFIYFCSKDDKSIQIREVIIFSALCLLLGLCKLPYLAFIFLLLFVPNEKFNTTHNPLLLSLLCIGIVSVIGVIYSHFATDFLLHSWRSQYNLINSTQQIDYLISHPIGIFKFFKLIFGHLLEVILGGGFNFFHGNLNNPHYHDTFYLIKYLLMAFLFVVLLMNPNKFKFNLKSKLGSLLIVLIVYVGTCFVQLLTWSWVGHLDLGVTMRYFIPLFALIPIIINLNIKKIDYHKFKDYSIVFIIGFMATLVLTFAINYY